VRLSDSERELLFEALKEHAAAGRLDVAELERRVELIAAAQTQEDAAPVLGDLPPLAGKSAAGSSSSGTGRREATSRGKGHGEADAPAAGWRPTAERFRDPRSGRIMRVWVDGGGGRHYVADRDR
jgi:Domain of unknown function (DUF1707)